MLWENLESIFHTISSHSLSTDLWFRAGDFNDILTQQDKWEGISINYSHSSRFWSCVNHCNLINLVFKGCRYTWPNHRKHSKGLILERLDRCFSNSSWLDYYPNVSITHLPKTHSDHNSLLVKLSSQNNPLSHKSFRLEKYWLDHPEFQNIIRSSWQNRNLSEAISHFKDKATSWSNTTFGDFPHKKGKDFS